MTAVSNEDDNFLLTSLPEGIYTNTVQKPSLAFSGRKTFALSPMGYSAPQYPLVTDVNETRLAPVEFSRKAMHNEGLTLCAIALPT